MQGSAAGAASGGDLDELDRALVHALQIRPRAPWSLIGPVLGVDPVTAARRWKRLSAEGIAWVDGYLSPAYDHAVHAHVEIVTDGALLAGIATVLADDPEVLSLKQTSGSRDLLAIVVARDLGRLVDYVTERVCRVPGVRTTRIHVITMAPFEGNKWRLRALTPAQRARLTEPERERTAAPVGQLSPLDHRIAVALGRDGRLPLNELAAHTGTSVATVRRRLRTLVDSGRLSMRCTVARPLSGYPVSAVYFASVPAEHLDAATRALRTLPELRLCTVTAGPHNLILDMWLRALPDVHALEVHLARELSGLSLRVNERAVVLRTVKHVGRVLDRRGFGVKAVPMDLGQDAGPHASATAPGEDASAPVPGAE
ncbi:MULTISPECIES: AsnC family transcriptional regulator [unclassified Streptomyces]|uniref:Lrp/AsnC family transcriptional regulator n=1 Tax=unclassified Streptomyces TaxID=2593676 RepID=UPI002DDBE575|nr:AsnC family transcriptional regulator [Streptomyces sp. NBC_01775]WSB79714.1 AsnC family transcriptional regulator [Streptomyces sp. NBC_01775]WSS40793.1 AsnC family transcriptional regulator [Streptomyces sp. NBC_01187]